MLKRWRDMCGRGGSVRCGESRIIIIFKKKTLPV